MTMTPTATELKKQGNLLIAQLKYPQAEKVFRELVQEAPDEPHGYVGLARVYQVKNRLEETVALLDPVAANMQSARFHELLSSAYRALVLRGDLALVPRAIEAHERYLTKKRDPVALFYLGQIYDLAESHDRSFACYREAWEIVPKYREAYEAAVASAKKLGRSDLVNELERQRHPN